MRFRGPGRRSSPRTGLALALVLVTGLTLLFTQAPPLHLHSEGWGDTRQEKSVTVEGTIFVSISSYRDDECSYTVQHMFDQADVPERLFVGVCEQNWQDRESCRTGHLPLSLRSHVHYKLVNASEAKGPTYGRALAQAMYRGEDYYMQIDSHTQFAPGWDTRMVAMYKKLQKCNPKAVLSHYPASSEDLNDKEVPRICNSTWLDDVGVFRFWEAEEQLPTGQFVPTPYAAAGYMFFSGAVLKDVPFDPMLPYLFDGEEILYSARLWTHGWDIFTPVENLIFHHYEREKAKSVYADHDEVWWEQEQATLVKVRYLLGLSPREPNTTLFTPANLAKYGLGSERSVQEYYAFANIDVKANRSYSAEKFCGAENGRPPNECLRSISAPIDEPLVTQEAEEADAEAQKQQAEEQQRLQEQQGEQGQERQQQELEQGKVEVEEAAEQGAGQRQQELQQVQQQQQQEQEQQQQQEQEQQEQQEQEQQEQQQQQQQKQQQQQQQAQHQRRRLQ